MGRAEGAVEQHLRRGVESRGGLCLKFISSRSGVPDRIVVLDGRTVFVELKAPSGALSALQKVRIAELQGAGAEVRVLSSRTEVDTFLASFTSGTSA